MNCKGIHLDDANVYKIARNVKPYIKGVLEITDINRIYRQQGQLNVEVLGRGVAWLDTCCHNSLLEVSQFVATLEKHQGIKVACPEELDWRSVRITDAQKGTCTQQSGKSGYDEYLKGLLVGIVITRSKR